MSTIPDDLRRIIAANIRAERMKKYPGRGGCKQCAADFGVSPQQWSPWERGKRTPHETHLQSLADFFGVSVEDLRRDHSPPPPPEISPAPSSQAVVCTESDILWQLHKVFSGVANDGQRIHISLNIMLSKEAQRDT